MAVFHFHAFLTPLLFFNGERDDAGAEEGRIGQRQETLRIQYIWRWKEHRLKRTFLVYNAVYYKLVIFHISVAFTDLSQWQRGSLKFKVRHPVFGPFCRHRADRGQKYFLFEWWKFSSTVFLKESARGGGVITETWVRGYRIELDHHFVGQNFRGMEKEEALIMSRFHFVMHH